MKSEATAPAEALIQSWRNRCTHKETGDTQSKLGGASRVRRVDGAAHQRVLFFVYLNSGCSGLAGRPPMHCPVLHSPSPSLHAAPWTDGPTDRWMDDEDIRESAEGEKHFKLENKATMHFTTVSFTSE